MRPALVLLVLLVLLLAAGAWWALHDRAAAPRAERITRETPPPLPKEEEKPLPSRRLAGKVTGDAPLGGVRIRAEWEGGTGEGRTREDGSYEIGDPGATAFRLRAEAPDGRVGFAQAEAGAAKAPNIALHAAAGVTFVTEPAVPGARLEIGHGSDADWFWPFATARTGADGTVALRLPLGDHAVHGFSDGFGRASAAFTVTAEAQTVVVRFRPERRLTVTVVEAERRSPVEGARLLVFARPGGPYGVPDARTDAKGAALVRGLDATDNVFLCVVPPGETPQEKEALHRERHRVPDGVTAMTIEIGLPLTIEWEILAGDIPPPDDGTVIPLRPLPGAAVTPPPTGVMRGGKLVAEGWPFDQHVGSEALGPKGTVATLLCGPELLVGVPTKFEFSRTLAVTLLRPGGEPAPGTTVALFNGGNNLVCQAAAGDDGVARMDQLAAQVLDLIVVGKHEWDRRESVGTVDLRGGDVAVTHTLTPEKRWEVTLLLDGKPFLPEACGVQVNGEFQFSAVDRDPEQGRITGTFVPRGPLAYINLLANGYRRVSEQVAVPPGDEPLRHTIELDRGFECRVRIVGEMPKRIRLEFQKSWPAGWETIDRDSMWPRASRRDAEGGFIFTGLEAGRYRMRTAREGILWGPVELGGGGEATLVIDFTRFSAIRGRVEVPEGYGFQEVQLEMRGDDVAEEESHSRPGFPVNREDGTFDVQIPGDRPVALSARHPLLTCAATVETTAGLDGAVLKLVEGPTLAFRLPGWEAAYAKFTQWPRPPVRVRLLREGAAAIERMAIAKDGAWRAGDFAPGRYDVWIDVPEAVPQLLRDRELKAGPNELGDVPSLPGSRIRVRVLARDGFAAPSVHAWVEHMGEPKYHRMSQTGGGMSEFAVSGLGAGRFRVTGGGLTARRWLNEEIDLDGANDVDLTLDLR